MSRYGSNYEWWMNEPKCKDIRHWTLDDGGKITIQDILEAMKNHPGCHLAIVEPMFNLFVERIGSKEAIK